MLYENATIYVSKVAEVDRTIAHTVESAAISGTGSHAPNTSFNNSQSSDDYVCVTDEQVFGINFIILFSLSLSVSHSRSGGWVTAPILFRKLHRRLGSL